jgi:hypothetical protein
MVVDDYELIKKYWQTNLLKYIALWTGFLLVYFIAFSITFWSVCITIQLIKKYIIVK